MNAFHSIVLALLSIASQSIVLASLSSSSVQILYAPTSLDLKPTSTSLKSSDFSKFVSLCLGFSTDGPNDWNGFAKYNNLRSIPKNVVTFVAPVSVEKYSSLAYSLEDDDDVSSQFKDISTALTSRNPLSLSKKFENVESGKELDVINRVMNQLQNDKSSANLAANVNLWFDLSKLDSANVPKIVDGFRQLFEDRVLIAWIYQKDAKVEGIVHRARRAAEDESKLNLAYEFDPHFHISFVLIGFTSVVLILAVFVVSVAMWNIDPGRDSIIYRLTAQKIKKDN